MQRNGLDLQIIICGKVNEEVAISNLLAIKLLQCALWAAPWGPVIPKLQSPSKNISCAHWFWVDDITNLWSLSKVCGKGSSFCSAHSFRNLNDDGRRWHKKPLRRGESSMAVRQCKNSEKRHIVKNSVALFGGFLLQKPPIFCSSISDKKDETFRAKFMQNMKQIVKVTVASGLSSRRISYFRDIRHSDHVQYTSYIDIPLQYSVQYWKRPLVPFL